MLPIPTPQCVESCGHRFHVLAFYYPDRYTPWDQCCQSPFLSNFYPCPVTLTLAGITASFQTSEAAYQAIKWWKLDSIRSQFEGYKSATEAYELKKSLPNPDLNYAGLGREGAMKAVLQAKFRQAEFTQALLNTKGAYLMEHNEKVGRDFYWSDNYDGTGQNRLGYLLMEMRLALGGQGVPPYPYHRRDFAAYINRL
jgi:predicted NAD-dependent protein-ADP-ribosyltransferase YbiA (DUF1768 family)